MEVFVLYILPSIKNRNNAFIALSCNAKESRHGHVEMVVRRVTPPSVVVWRAEVGGGYRHTAASKTPFWVGPGVTYHLVASATSLTTSEKHSAHRRSVDPKSSMKCIIITTSSP